jgi:hypothetical protein
MGSPAWQGPPVAPASKKGPSDKVRIAYISAAGVIVAAIISGIFLVLSRGGGTPVSPITSNNKVVVNVSPPVAPPTTPAFRPFTAYVSIPAGDCAYVFSEPRLLQQDILGCINPNTTVEIYCTAESATVNNSSVWDLIYYRTSWGVAGYIPDAYVYTGTNNAVMPSCVT